MQASAIANKHILSSSFLLHHSQFLDEWDYQARKLEGQTWDDVTHLDVSIRPWGTAAIEVNCHGPNARMLMRRVCKQMGGKWDKSTTSYEFQLSRGVDFEGAKITVTVCTSREAVCTPRVVGQETKVIPAQEERTVTEDIVEWDCPPSLLELTNGD